MQSRAQKANKDTQSCPFPSNHYGRDIHQIQLGHSVQPFYDTWVEMAKDMISAQTDVTEFGLS